MKKEDYNIWYQKENREKIRVQRRRHYIENRDRLLADKNSSYIPVKRELLVCGCGEKIEQPQIGKTLILCFNCRKKARREYEHAWALENRERQCGYTKKWKLNNPDKVKEYEKSGNVKLIRLARSRVRIALRENSKSAHTVELIGCRWSELRMWLEFQFQDGMSWENYGPVWHIDHIRPCASYDLSDPEQQKDCFNYKNLQPLFALDNLRKGDKY